ncbi:MnmC family methyltransferase [Sulfurovum sp. XTW-4]|uniref:MnmC family methyltransferase n=1 Tax=Sulfurovum xiamenensis TaxID=3019066 RepID=A0ABT7QRU8_9BACT|nr:MnmC family methyltransferase [Sulfurovum xiamenensis]MDM5263806.1 MnmC family methyltransferase [Sulfurovum xiamenensis]
MYNKSLREEKKLVLCEDGTHTLFSVEFDEPYHSTKDGALHESLEKHVKPALTFSQNKSELRILDICFGLGYNTFATLYYIKTQGLKTKVHILSPEFDEGLVRSLDTFDFPPEFEGIQHIIKAISADLYYEDEQFKIEILLGDARESIPKIEDKIDIIYQDAFSPAHNPLLWTKEHFTDIRVLCKEDALLTTYSTAAAVRLGLYENDFFIFVHRAEMMRFSTIASLKMLDGLEYIDMELKKLRNPQARSMKDEAYLKDMDR